MTQLIFAVAPDIAGKFRGKAFPAEQLAYRQNRGLGWTPTNVQITCLVLSDEFEPGSVCRCTGDPIRNKADATRQERQCD